MAIDRFPPNTPLHLNMPERMKPKRKPGLKRIEAHTDEELDAAITKAVEEYGDKFWLLLHGIDAYMERRKRRDAKRLAENYVEEQADPWGNS